MRVTIEFTDGAIRVPEREPGGLAGAVVEFRGAVRGEEGGRAIGGLIYEIYEPMARRVVQEIFADLARAHAIRAAVMIHRHGIVRVGEDSIFLRIEAAHRGPAFRAAGEFMDRLKAEAPIWKTGTVPC